MLVLKRCLVQILTGTPAILTKVFHCFPQSLQENAGLVSWLVDDHFHQHVRHTWFVEASDKKLLFADGVSLRETSLSHSHIKKFDTETTVLFITISFSFFKITFNYSMIQGIMFGRTFHNFLVTELKCGLRDRTPA